MKLALRQLLKTPGFTAITILTLALGIGSATTAFTALNAILLKPLPLIQNQDRMLWLNEAVPSKGIDSTDICYADFVDWRARSQTLEALWVYETRTLILTGRDEPERVNGIGLSAGAFQAMGVAPILGRNFLPTDNDPKSPPVALLSYGLWQRRFASDPAILEQEVRINNVPTRIVGIMPNGWRYPETGDLWLPLRPDANMRQNRGYFSLSGHAMLKPGVTLDQARAELAVISGSLAKDFPASNDGLVAVIRPVREEAVDDSRMLTILLFGGVMFVFFIACANVSNLLLSRAVSRTQEIAVRLALGASRGRLIRQFLAESLLLGVAGASLGLLFASWGVDAMLAIIPVELPFWVNFDFDFRVFGFVTLLTLLGGALCGFVPAWQATRLSLVDDLKDGGRGAGGGSRAHRLRSAFVVGEVALAFVLLVGAGLMLRSFFELNRTAPGFEPRGVMTFRVGLPNDMAADKATLRRFFRDLLPRLSALPGVESVGATTGLPGLGQGGYAGILTEGAPELNSLAEQPNSLVRAVSPGFFDSLRIPLQKGRHFTANDDEQHPMVVIVDEAFAKKFFPNRDPIGARFRFAAQSASSKDWFQIVGVVGNTRRWLDRDDPNPTMYRPIEQDPRSFLSIALRVHGDPSSYTAAARATVLQVNSDLPIYFPYTYERAIARSDTIWIRNFFGYLFAAFSVVALVLASIGIYGVMAYAVMQRTQEFGVRMALGASPTDLIRLVLGRGARLVGLGLVLGLIAAYFAAQLLANQLYGVTAHDPSTFVLVPLLLAAVALLACLLPTRRALRVDPLVALRGE